MPLTTPAPGTIDLAGRRILAVVLAAGVGLRAWQLLAAPPLWLDELALANGLLSGPFSGLFDGPSDFAQVAPPGFLALEWLLARAAPDSDIALRLPAFAFGCAALWTTWLAARELMDERDAWVAAALVASGGPLIMMSAQVKPYAADVFFASLLVALVLRTFRRPTREARLALIVTGILAPLFSLGAIMVLGGAGACLLLRLRTTPRDVRSTVAVLSFWAAAALGSLALTSRLLGPDTGAFMATYWTDAFPPWPPATLWDFLWPVRTVLALMWSLLGLRQVGILGVLIAVGALALLRRNVAAAALLVVPFIAATLAATLRLYPFGARLSHWTAPLLALLLATTLAAISIRAKRWPVLSMLPAVVVVSVAVTSLWHLPPPFVRDNVKPLMARLTAEATSGDALYVYSGAWHSWARYGRGFGGRSGVDVIPGGCPADFPRGLLRELDQLRGRPGAWLFLARLQTEVERNFLLGYLDAIGVHTDSLIVEAPGLDVTARVELHRYDLSGAGRQPVSAATFPVPERGEALPTSCRRLDAMFRRSDGTSVLGNR